VTLEPDFLSLQDVLRIHADQVERYGGSQGVRDWSLLHSAIAAPQSGSMEGYFHADLFEMAAAYTFHLIKNHPFIDGNKRVGAVSAVVFFELNGIELRAEVNEFEKVMWRVAEGNCTKSELSEFYRRNSRKPPKTSK
jgi:death on curing protein